MTLDAAISFFIAIFIFGITPGPGIFALLATALEGHTKDCIPLSIGMTISDIIYLLLAIFGLSAIAENYTTLFIVIRYIGATYLLYLGWKMWTAKINTDFTLVEEKKTSWFAGFIQGFLISASNPKVILFYIAFLPTFINLQELTKNDIVLVCVLTFFALMIGLMLVSICASAIRGYLKTERSIKVLNRTAGSIMLAAGLFLISRGFSSL